ncbi:hypothetical protein G4L39_04750 [Limisphaera ngatamarikiensis]|uniref:Septum formation initiator family protein n=1 Tax=Limisphaera ngatamarikiensis TaxID=1324935 RepID=A0A6M1RM15_9BACT|nr:hypothetical protein [Limisphaera ngatamarikiensis]NGO38703.1 hypothetical protein [Limisphaera ngatamarikiensis]
MSGGSRKSGGEAWLWPALWVVVLCLGLGGLGLGYVWLKNQVDELGRQIKQREQRLAELRLLNERLRRQLATLQSPRFLEQRVRELQLGLVPAHPAQVWRLPEPQGWPEPQTASGRTPATGPGPG